MDNRVGENTPDEATLTKLLGDLKAAMGALQKFCITLTQEERKHLSRPRREAEPMMRLVYELAKKHSISVPGVNLDAMQNDLKLAQTLERFESLAIAIHQMVTDTQAQAEHEANQAFLAYYGVMSHIAHANGGLQKDLLPAKEFMSSPRKKIKT